MSFSANSKSDRTANSSERYMAFLLGQEQYAIPLLQVKEVIEMSQPVPVPNSPPHLKGIINLRGQVIEVIDLRTKLKLPKIENGPKTAIIILDLNADFFIGVIVDRIISVLAFHKEEIGSPPGENRGIEEQFLTGVAQKDHKMTLLLDICSAIDLDAITTNKSIQTQNVS